MLHPLTKLHPLTVLHPLTKLHPLNQVYAGSVGVEYMHIKDQAQRGWL